MTHKKIGRIIGLALALLLTGCELPTDSGTPTTAEMAEIKPSSVSIKYEDSAKFFEKCFPNGEPIKPKDNLETPAEYRARLSEVGVEGREFVLLIPPELCDIIPGPDNSFFVIVSKSSGSTNSYNPNEEPYGITVFSKTESTTDQPGQLDYFNFTYYKICPDGFWSLPLPLRWRDPAVPFECHFGIPVQSTDEPQLPDLWRGKELGLAVKVRVGDLSKADSHFGGFSHATVDDPAEASSHDALLPVTLLQAWVVNLSTGKSIVTWQPPEQGSDQ